MNNRSIILKTFYTFFVNGLMALMIGSVMPFVIEEYGINYGIAGIFLSLHSMGNLFASFIAGYSIYKFGRKRSIVFLSSFIAISYFGIITLDYLPLLFVMFFLTGLGRGSISNVNNAIINDIAVGKSSLLNLLHTCFAVGAFLTPILASFITGAGFDWKIVVAIGIGFSITMVFTYLFMDMDKIEVKKSSNEKSKSNVFYKNIDFYLASLLLFFYLGAENSVNGWLVTYFKDMGIMSTAFAQRLLSTLWVVIIFGRLSTAYLSNKFKNQTLILINSTGAAIFFILLLTSKDVWVITGAIVGFGFFLAGIYPTTISSTGKIIKGSSAAMATILAVAGVGGIIMPYMTGVIAEKIGIAGGMSVIIINIVLMLVLAIILKIRENKISINALDKI